MSPEAKRGWAALAVVVVGLALIAVYLWGGLGALGLLMLHGWAFPAPRGGRRGP